MVNSLLGEPARVSPATGFRPNFLGIGAAKSGTSSIARMLSTHPEISFPTNGAKELHYFDENYFIHSQDWYFAQFEKNVAVGEFTPSYLFMPECRDRIFATLGAQVKFIVALRNPVDRAFSHYCHAVNNWNEDRYRELGYPLESLSFEEALKKENERLASGKYSIRHLSYFQKGLYARQLKWYFQRFSRENFFVYLLEEYAQDPARILGEACAFLGVNPDFQFQGVSKKVNAQTNRLIEPQTKEDLLRKYLGSIEELEDLLGRELYLWKGIPPAETYPLVKKVQKKGSRIEQPIFIVGCPRSGTTLLQCMLSEHENTFSLPETHFFRPILPILKLKPMDVLAPESLEKIYAAVVEKMGLVLPQDVQSNNSVQAEEGTLTPADVFCQVVERYRPERDLHKARRLVEKTPLHVLHMEEILGCFPTARFINLVRDPRDVVSSRMNLPSSQSRPIKSLAKEWNKCVNAAARFSNIHPDRLLTLRYEDLVSDPMQSLYRVCQFLELEPRPGMLTDFARQYGACTLPEREYWKEEVKTGKIINKTGVWRDRTSASQAREIEEQTQKLMDAYGYIAEYVEISRADLSEPGEGGQADGEESRTGINFLSAPQEVNDLEDCVRTADQAVAQSDFKSAEKMDAASVRDRSGYPRTHDRIGQYPGTDWRN